MSDHPPEVKHVCRVCGLPVVRVDGRWWHDMSSKEWMDANDSDE